MEVVFFIALITKKLYIVNEMVMSRILCGYHGEIYTTNCINNIMKSKSLVENTISVC